MLYVVALSISTSYLSTLQLDCVLLFHFNGCIIILQRRSLQFVLLYCPPNYTSGPQQSYQHGISHIFVVPITLLHVCTVIKHLIAVNYHQAAERFAKARANFQFVF